MAKKQTPQASLSPAQQEIMEIVWEHDEVSVKLVRTILSRKRAVARNTVRTMLERMEQKGWLTRRQEGRKYLYSAALPRQATIAEKVIEVIDNVCGGSAEVLVTALLDYRDLTKSELHRIRKILDKAHGDSQSRKG